MQWGTEGEEIAEGLCVPILCFAAFLWEFDLSEPDCAYMRYSYNKQHVSAKTYSKSNFTTRTGKFATAIISGTFCDISKEALTAFIEKLYFKNSMILYNKLPGKTKISSVLVLQNYPVGKLNHNPASRLNVQKIDTILQVFMKPTYIA